MRKYFPSLQGNDRLTESIGRDIASGKMTHAYVLEGRKGTGKHTLAKLIAAAVSCEHRGDESESLPCGHCENCRKILSDLCPDVSLIGKGDKAGIGADVIRELRRDVSIAPNDTETKVYVIEDADLMTVQAQNAFLLTLEEPPAYVLFLLLCENASSLLETIRSRAPTRHLRPLSAEMTAELLAKKSPEAAKLQSSNPQAFAELVAIADGSPGRALELTDEKKRAPILALRQTARGFADLFTAGKNAGDAVKYLSSLPSKRDELLVSLEEIRLCLRDLLLCKQAEHPPLCFFSDREEAAVTAEKLTVPTLLQLADSVESAIEKLRRNANARLTLVCLGRDAGLLH